MLTYGSLFAGVGGIDLGLDSVGMKCKFQVEWDQHCLQTLGYHWPNVPRWGDIANVNGFDLPFVDVIAFGSPCQDLSVAGKRAGLEGERSKLFHEAIRVIKEMREKSNGQYPKWSIWENVAGALSSNTGADFGEVLRQMDEAGACFSEWAVLDAQYFGVPQRRRRIFVISCYDLAIAKRSPEQILPLQKSLPGNSPKIFVKQRTPTPDAPGGIGAGRKIDTKIFLLDGTRVGDIRVYNEPVQTLKSRMGTGGNNVPVILDEFNQDKPALIRKFTPLECERLMGWPDNHTLYRADGKQNSDTTRYKMCGNGVVSPVVKWIAENIINI